MPKEGILYYFNCPNLPKRAMIATCHKKRKINQTYMKYCKLWFALHYRAIEKVPFCYGANKPILV